MKKLLTTISTITLSLTLSLSLLLTPILTSPTLASEANQSEHNFNTIEVKTNTIIETNPPDNEEYETQESNNSQNKFLSSFSSKLTEVTDMRYNAGTSKAYWGLYTGTVKNKKPEGYGIWTGDEKGRSYKGNWKNGKKDGEGTYDWPNGDLYMGNWKNDKADGKGKIWYDNGEEYLGSWSKGYAQGKGTYTFADGSYVVGTFNKGKVTKGILYDICGEKIGNYKG